jgi:flavin reductase (DIM6/NTAB) family NADH-FMN oxidoreductase RutF
MPTTPARRPIAPQRRPIAPASFVTEPFHLLNDRWMLLTAGEFTPGGFNTMTVSWGGLGVLWNRPVAWTVVRPDRRTCELMEASPDFTLAAFPDELHKALELCGMTSGRQVDKVAKAGLTACAATAVASPGFVEADLLIECRKLYVQDLDPTGFVNSLVLSDTYQDGVFHRFFIGEIVAITGTDAYTTPQRP